MKLLLVLILSWAFGVAAQENLLPRSRVRTTPDPIGTVTGARLMELDRDGQFNPQRIISRAELATILVRTFNLNRRMATRPPAPVQDVPRNHWAHDNIQIVLRTGVMEGYGRSLFHPNQRINRAEAIASFANAYGVFQFPDSTVQEILSQFGDSREIPSWARKSVATALYEGLVDVDEQGRIRPLQPMTRLDMAELLSAYLSLRERN